MCQRCDYHEFFQEKGLAPTAKRLRIMEIIGNSPAPLSAGEIFSILNRAEPVNRVTVYRVLEVLVEKNLVDRISSGDRSFRYGPAPNPNHRAHPHFFCTHCGNMECLNPESIDLDTAAFERTFPGTVEKVEVRVDGVCKSCRRR